MRKWEIWDERRAGNLAKAWGDPNKCAKGEVPSNGRMHWSLIEKASSLVEGNSVLDVGCGFGHLFSLLRDRDYLGVDTSESMIRMAREFFPEDKDSFQIGDTFDLSSLPEFDTVVAIGLIIHIPSLEKSLKQLWSRTKMCLVFSAWVGDSQLVSKIAAGAREGFTIRYPLEDFNLIFSKLGNLGKVERYKHPHSRGNYFFKLWNDKMRIDFATLNVRARKG